MSRRSVRRNLARLRSHRSYTTADLAAALDVHVRTIQAWRKAGLTAVDEREHPLLFLGSTVRRFLRERLAKRKVKLDKDQLYCIRCSKGVTPSLESVSVVVSDRRLGNGACSVRIVGKCPECGLKVSRLSSTKAIFLTAFWPKLERADKRLTGFPSAHSNTDIKQGR